MKYFNWLLALLILFLNIVCFAQKPKIKKNKPDNVDLIVFSYDRPLQLYACLESIKCCIKKTGVGEIFVIYRASDDKFDYSSCLHRQWQRTRQCAPLFLSIFPRSMANQHPSYTSFHRS